MSLPSIMDWSHIRGTTTRQVARALHHLITNEDCPVVTYVVHNHGFVRHAAAVAQELVTNSFPNVARLLGPPQDLALWLGTPIALRFVGNLQILSEQSFNSRKDRIPPHWETFFDHYVWDVDDTPPAPMERTRNILHRLRSNAGLPPVSLP